MNEDLPKLTPKQQTFLLRYSINGHNATDAYKNSYDCENMSPEAINVEASRLLKNPKVSLWIEYADRNVQQVFEDEIKYSAKDCFDELAELQSRCRKSTTTYNVEKGCIELKGKLAGHFVDKHKIEAQNLSDVLDKLK